MSYTADDLTATQRAIAALGAGESVTQVRWANGKTISYNVTDLPSLERIESKIRMELAKADPSSKRRRTHFFRTSKGL